MKIIQGDRRVTVYAGELKNILEGLQVLMAERLPVKVAYKLHRIFRVIGEEFRVFEAARKTLIEQHAKRGTDGKMQVAGDRYVLENEAKFNAGFAELAGQELKLDIDLIKLDDLSDIRISGIDIHKLGNIIEDEEG